MNPPAESKKILFVNHSIPPWEYTGTPITTLNHARGMQKRGFEVAILVPSTEEVRVGFHKGIVDGFVLYQVPCFDRQKAFLGTLDKEALQLYLEMIAHIAGDFCPDIVHINDYLGMPADILAVFHDLGYTVVRNVCNDEEICHQYYPVIVSESSAELCKGPNSIVDCADCYLTHFEGARRDVIRPDSRNRLAAVLTKQMAFIRKIYRYNVDAVVFTSAPFKDHFTSFVPIDETKIRIIPRGFNLSSPRNPEPFKKIRRGEIRFAFFGSLTLNKGIDVLLKAFQRIVLTHRSFRLELYGILADPECSAWVQRLEKEFPDRLKFHGDYKPEHLSDLAAHIDLAIVPSYFDTYNRVVRECLYFGVPVIASDFFGAFIVNDGVNGLKIPIGDENALASAMERVLLEPDLLKALRDGAWATEIPTLDAEIEALIGLYETLLLSRKTERAKLQAGKKNRRKSLYQSKNSWSSDAGLYLRDVDRLLLSILENNANLPPFLSCKLFVDAGSGFNERDTVRERITRDSSGSFQAIFDLRSFSIIRGVRFDPWEGAWGWFRPDEIMAELRSGQRIGLALDSIRAINGEIESNGFYIFKTTDPIIELPGISEQCATLTIRGNLDLMDAYHMEEVWTNDRQKWDLEKNAFQERLARMQQELGNLEYLLSAAITVRGWHEEAPDSRPLVLFGTGSLAEWVLRLIDRDRFRILCCFDNRSHTEPFHNLAVQKPSFIPGTRVIISSLHDIEIRRQLRALGYNDDDLLSLRMSGRE